MKVIRILLVIMVFFNISVSNAQYPVPFYFMSGGRAKKSIKYQVQEGTVSLKDGKVLTGRFQFDWWMFPVKNFVFYKDSSSKEKIKFKDIKQASFAGIDTNIAEKTDSTAFVNVDGKLLRKLTSGKINIYDKLIVVKEVEGALGETIFVKESKKLRRIESLRRFNKWYQGLADAYPNLKVRNEYLNKIEIIREIQKYNVLKE